MFVLLVVVVTAAGAQEADQKAELQYTVSIVSLEFPSNEPRLFWERFKVAFDKGTEELFEDKFHPFNSMTRTMRINVKNDVDNREHEHILERNARIARNTFAEAAVVGLREATVDSPLLLWLENKQGFLADLLRNSLGATEEEALDPLDLSYRAVERSWWRRLSENGTIRYGVRPFRTDPYAFFSLAIRDGETLLALTHFRYRFREFAEHTLEFAMSLPLPHKFSVDVGTAYEVLQTDGYQKLVVKLFRQIGPQSIAHVGFEVRDHPVLLGGFSTSW